MAVMNATEPDGWTPDPLDNDVNVYFDDIFIDSEMNPYAPTTTVYLDRSGQISYILNNPLTTELIFEDIGKIELITIYSINGKEVKQFRTSHQESYRLPVADLAKGVYIVKFQKADGQFDVSKIIKR